MKTVIIDYGMGNVASVQKALSHLNIINTITSDHQEIIEADSIVLPGVGSFQRGMQHLKEQNLIDVLTEQVIHNKKPFLGICLGMQLLATKGNEPVATEGLGWINGEVKRIFEPGKRVPHLGWNTINHLNGELIDSVNEKDFYFIHSYHFDVKDSSHIAATVNYGKDYVAAVQRDNIFATQFHPEKSQEYGLKLLKKFFDYYA